jgi:drug/metabolite transporter (DMT)-like permease
LVFVVLAWGGNFSIIKLAYQDFSPAAVALLRYLGMLVVMGGVLIALRQLPRLDKVAWRGLLVGGFLANGFYMILFLEGMKGVGAAEGAVILATAPLWMAVLSVLGGQEKLSWPLGLGAGLAYSGVATVILGGKALGGSTLWGIGLVLASAVVWAWSAVTLRPHFQGRDPLPTYFASFLGASVVLVPYGLLASLNTPFAAITPAGWGALIYLVLIAGILAFVAYYWGLRDCGPVKTAFHQYFIPPTAALVEWLTTGRSLLPIQWLGIGLLFVGVVIGTQRKPAPQTDADPAL